MRGSILAGSFSYAVDEAGVKQIFSEFITSAIQNIEAYIVANTSNSNLSSVGYKGDDGEYSEHFTMLLKHLPSFVHSISIISLIRNTEWRFLLRLLVISRCGKYSLRSKIRYVWSFSLVRDVIRYALGISDDHITATDNLLAYRYETIDISLDNKQGVVNWSKGCGDDPQDIYSRYGVTGCRETPAETIDKIKPLQNPPAALQTNAGKSYGRSSYGDTSKQASVASATCPAESYGSSRSKSLISFRKYLFSQNMSLWCGKELFLLQYSNICNQSMISNAKIDLVMDTIQRLYYPISSNQLEVYRISVASYVDSVDLSWSDIAQALLCTVVYFLRMLRVAIGDSLADCDACSIYGGSIQSEAILYMQKCAIAVSNVARCIRLLLLESKEGRNDPSFQSYFNGWCAFARQLIMVIISANDSDKSDSDVSGVGMQQEIISVLNLIDSVMNNLYFKTRDHLRYTSSGSNESSTQEDVICHEIQNHQKLIHEKVLRRPPKILIFCQMKYLENILNSLENL